MSDNSRNAPVPPHYQATSGARYTPADQVSSGSCPGGGLCNGTGGHAACDGCPALNNRISKTAQLALTQSQRPSPGYVSQRDSNNLHTAVVTAQDKGHLESFGYYQSTGSENIFATCQNCHTTTTPLWRRDGSGHTICNACGSWTLSSIF